MAFWRGAAGLCAGHEPAELPVQVRRRPSGEARRGAGPGFVLAGSFRDKPLSVRIVDQAEWRGSRGAFVRLVRWLVASAILHVPLTPLAALFGLAMLLLPREDEAIQNVPPITEIPIELFPEMGAPAPAPPSVAPAEPAIVVSPPAPKRVARKRILEDAGVPPPEDGGADAGARDAGSPPVDAGTRERRPLAVAGARGVVDPNANIKVLIDTERLRNHPLGARIGKLLGSVYQWRDFFGPTGIDPVRDIDRIFITGPQLRDSSGVVALIQHSLAPERLKAAIDLLVQRDRKGSWLDGGVPIAKARADRADRYFVMPASNLLVVTPESALKSAERLGPNTSLPRIPPPDVVTAHVQTPWRALIGTGLAIPRSLAWAEARVTPESGGGATVSFLAEDEDDAQATLSAAEVERAIRDGLDLLARATNIFSLLFGGKTPRLVESVSFRAEGKRVIGTLTFTEGQVTRILDLASRMIVPPSPRPSEPASSASGRSTDSDPRTPTAGATSGIR